MLLLGHSGNKCRACQGANDAAMDVELPSMPKEQRVVIINKLLTSKRIQVLQGPNNTLFYKELSVEEQQK